MPLLKPVFKNKKQSRLAEIGTGRDLLKMYKHFPNIALVEEENKADDKPDVLGCYITRVLMDSGYIWFKKTRLHPAKGLPGAYKLKKWQIEGFTTESPDMLRLRLHKEGWITPRSYWTGPSALRPVTGPRIRLSVNDTSNTGKVTEADNDVWLPSALINSASTKVTTEKEEQEAEIKPIPKLTEKWFWDDLTLEEQTTILRKWGYLV